MTRSTRHAKQKQHTFVLWLIWVVSVVLVSYKIFTTHSPETVTNTTSPIIHSTKPIETLPVPQIITGSGGKTPKVITGAIIKPAEIKPDTVVKKSVDACDPKDDTSLCRFVGQSVHFTDKKHVPPDLILAQGKYIVSTKPANLRKEALEALKNLSAAFYKQFSTPITLVSWYRDYSYQAGIKSRGCPDDLCAKAGYSEHQTGLAVDLFEASTEDEFLAKSEYREYFAWLKDNAAKYGFHNSYQKWKETDGYSNEPWHWRYLGIPFAQKLQTENKSLTEWYYQNYSDSIAQ